MNHWKICHQRWKNPSCFFLDKTYDGAAREENRVFFFVAEDIWSLENILWFTHTTKTPQKFDEFMDTKKLMVWTGNSAEMQQFV